MLELRLGFTSAEASAAAARHNKECAAVKEAQTMEPNDQQLLYIPIVCSVVTSTLSLAPILGQPPRATGTVPAKVLLAEHGRTARHLTLHARAVLDRDPACAVDDLLAAAQPLGC